MDKRDAPAPEAASAGVYSADARTAAMKQSMFD